MVGSVVHGLKRFWVISAWGTSRSQRWLGKSKSTPANIEMKWALNVLMALSAAFLLCISGGTSWYLTFHLLIMVSLYSLLASLSKTCKSTSKFAALSFVIIASYAAILCLSFLDAKGCANIRLEEWYATIMYWLPALDFTGNLPVSSVYNLLW